MYPLLPPSHPRTTLTCLPFIPPSSLDRVRAGVDPASQVMGAVLPAFIALICMWVGASWLLVHGAAQSGGVHAQARQLARCTEAAGDEAAAATQPALMQPLAVKGVELTDDDVMGGRGSEHNV